MRSSDLRVRILAIIGATGLATAGVAACGSESSTSEQTDAAAAATADGSGDAREASPGTDSAALDTGTADALGDASADTGFPSIRRPFLVGRSLRSAPSEPRGDWATTSFDAEPGDPGALPAPLGLDPATSRELARAWLKDGLEEHASIAAFARFTMLLLSVGAPPELVVGAQRASIDEVIHARDCFALAHRYEGGAALGPGALDVHDTLGALTLAELAALCTEEGCVGETLGVALAVEQLELVKDPAVRRVLTRIVRDEARHSELAWRFVAWAMGEEQRGSAGASGVAAAVARAADHALRVTRAMEIRVPPADLAAWHAHGRLSCAEARVVSERAIREIVEPCLAALGIGTPAQRAAPAATTFAS
jgi:hypothetical protein